MPVRKSATDIDMRIMFDAVRRDEYLKKIKSIRKFPHVAKTARMPISVPNMYLQYTAEGSFTTPVHVILMRSCTEQNSIISYVCGV